MRARLKTRRGLLTIVGGGGIETTMEFELHLKPA
jgi:hypothetical protein